MKTKMHYAPIDLIGDIPVHEFNNSLELLYFVRKVTSLQSHLKEIVWVLSVNNEVYVTHDRYHLFNLFLTDFMGEITEGLDIFLFEEQSYEEAYELALGLKEECPLCYKKDD